ncbi:hypothetical protein [Novosphingobium terrae]|uniref:hypothetical protein n=1 Tax=Novosphingobium terrae TaxID=2726189 RepID=UPI001980D29E|nr:hypothetical protein [Novosphingobium terrae]
MPPDDPELLASHAAPVLAPLERTVVALALRDPLWSVPTWRAPHPRRWFHVSRPDVAWLQLANPRLERLRRFVILLRHGQPVEDDATTLLTCGFSPGQILEVRMLTDLHTAA